MVLSNKKLKEKLRAAKAQLLSASDAQTPTIANSSGIPKSESQESAKSLIASAAQKAKLSKTNKRKRKALTLKENGESMTVSDEDVSNEDEKTEGKDRLTDVEKKKKKRKTDDDVGKEVKREEAKEKKKMMKKKKKKKKKKKTKDKEDKKENPEIGGAEETFANDNGVSENHSIQEMEVAANIEESLDDCMKVYVGGIPYYSTEDDIRSYFESCGTITEIDCMKFPESGKFRGIAIISFRTEAAAKRALANDGSDMGGLFLKIQSYKSTRAIKTLGFSPALVEGYNRIYVGNLAWDITEDDLRKVFSSCNIKSIRFGEDKETGEFRGYAHIDFSDSSSLSMALKLDQTVVCGRPVRISAAVPKKESDRKLQSTAGSATPSAHKNKSIKKPQYTDVSAPSALGKESDSKSQPTLDTAPADGDGLANVSGKIRRRTCYECGERGHLSSSCPKAQSTAENTPSASINESVTKSQSTAGSTPSASIKESVTTNSRFTSGSSASALREESGSKSQPTPDATAGDGAGVTNVSGKIRRRTCYECGERGHLSSACPKSQSTAGNTPSASINELVTKSHSTAGSTLSASIKEPVTTKPQSTAGSNASAPIEESVIKSQAMPDTTVADGAGVANLSGKIRRRTCYECGERGHLSSACPKKLSFFDQINSVPS